MELDEGLKAVIAKSFGATEDEAVIAVARGLGFKSTSSQLRELIRRRVAALKAQDVLVDRDGMLAEGSGAPPQ